MTGGAVTAEPGGVAVVGLGNVLMGDDAFGPWVIASLEANYRFPDGVDLVDAGTPGHELSVYLEGRELLVVVDAVRAAGEPGELRIFRGEEIVATPPMLVTGPHEPGLREALLRLTFQGRAPREVVLVGVVPSTVELGTGLSSPVLAAVPGAEKLILGLLSGHGVFPEPEAVRSTPAPWWE